MGLSQFVNYARKFFVALVAALAILGVALQDGGVSASEWVQVAIAFASALGVYQISNKGTK